MPYSVRRRACKGTARGKTTQTCIFSRGTINYVLTYCSLNDVHKSFNGKVIWRNTFDCVIPLESSYRGNKTYTALTQCSKRARIQEMTNDKRRGRGGGVAAKGRRSNKSESGMTQESRTYICADSACLNMQKIELLDRRNGYMENRYERLNRRAENGAANPT